MGCFPNSLWWSSGVLELYILDIGCDVVGCRQVVGLLVCDGCCESAVVSGLGERLACPRLASPPLSVLPLPSGASKGFKS